MLIVQPPFDMNSHGNQHHISLLLCLNQLSRPVPLKLHKSTENTEDKPRGKKYKTILFIIDQIFRLSRFHICTECYLKNPSIPLTRSVVQPSPLTDSAQARLISNKPNITRDHFSGEHDHKPFLTFEQKTNLSQKCVYKVQGISEIALIILVEFVLTACQQPPSN